MGRSRQSYQSSLKSYGRSSAINNHRGSTSNTGKHSRNGHSHDNTHSGVVSKNRPSREQQIQSLLEMTEENPNSTFHTQEVQNTVKVKDFLRSRKSRERNDPMDMN